MQRLVLLALLGATTVSAQDMGAVKACVDSTIAESAARFNGSAICPTQCATCHTTVITECPEECRNTGVFCGCSEVMFQAISDARGCCNHQAGFLNMACNFGIDEIQGICTGLVASMCNGLYPKDYHEPAKALAQVAANAFSHASVTKMEALQESAASLGETSSSYVSGHSKGAACVSAMEDVEREQAEKVQSDEMPDLRVAAEAIAARTSSTLGREMPSLKDKVHRAMVTAWTEDGPGMGAEEICEVVLRHHDSL